MKITSVDVMQIKSGNAGASRGAWSPVVIRINTDEGISGFGEVGLAYGKGWRGGFGMVCDFAEAIIGDDALCSDKIWNKLFRSTFWGMGGGTVVSAAMSAIDIALIDIKGKALGVPAYELLGGKQNDNLRVYASQLQYGWGEAYPVSKLTKANEYAEVTKAVMAEGYDALKVDPIAVPKPGIEWNRRGPLTNAVLNEVVGRVAAMREAGGDDMDIIIELHSNTDTTSAIQLAKALEPLRIFYIEEPVHPLNSEMMSEVAREISMPVASGERIYTRFGYRQFFENHSIKVIQPDICTCGGISEAKKICEMAQVYDANVQVHVCGSPISKAAALQVEAAIPNFLIHEHHQRALGKESRESCIHDYQPVNGRYSVPDLPGIGQEPTEEAMKNAVVHTISESKIYSMS
ncbi:MAG: mandelate racemase/muconate lactonizing enzyme family protein [Phoenicibacter congonensis]|uniref:Mandelate racemase/muconate lactonizing enzyme family protein n=1 Tax=Phoenicibacter congonensis TaxID=1944646 RepID=A0AA43RGT2_9ACTN|nr:mandelate racemase/muconate lactonizing enzyme family protein [Phoenicibacter congonensis]